MLRSAQKLAFSGDASVKTGDAIHIMESGVATLKKWGRQAQAWRLLLPMAQISDDKKYLDEVSARPSDRYVTDLRIGISSHRRTPRG